MSNDRSSRGWRDLSQSSDFGSVGNPVPGSGLTHSALDAIRLRVEDLQVRLGGEGPDVVDEVSFTVAAGEVLGLVGESGSGKTTVALAMLGYARRGLKISGGRVEVDGVDLLKLSFGDLRRIRGARVAYVPQDPASALNPGLRIGTQLRETLRTHRYAVDDEDSRIREVLAEVNLDGSGDMLKRYPHQLSGGQQQRVAIAMAFSCRPSLIILDEPTTGLDVTTQRHILDTVRSLCRLYGVAGVYVSHDLAVVGELVDQVAVMYAGRIMEIGPTERVFHDPIHPYTRGLLAAVPSPDRAETLLGIEGQPPRPTNRPTGCPYQPRCPVSVPACITEFPVIHLPERLVRCVRAHENERVAWKFETRRIPDRPPGVNGTLTVRGLSAAYGSNVILHDVDFELPSEQCVAVVGESGSGKTTLARCVVGLHSSWRGEVVFGDTPLQGGVRNRPRNSLQQIQYIFQSPYASLNPTKTIEQTLLQPLKHFFRLSSDEMSRRVASVLDDVSLGADMARRYPDQLSGGQRQRVAIARALIVEPTLLVCDEVTSALDVSVQAIIVELLRRLQAERNLSILFITHNLALVRSIAQSCVVLANGRIVEEGSVDDVLERPSHPYTKRLMEDVPKLQFGGQSAT